MLVAGAEVVTQSAVVEMLFFFNRDVFFFAFGFSFLDVVMAFLRLEIEVKLTVSCTLLTSAPAASLLSAI